MNLACVACVLVLPVVLVGCGRPGGRDPSQPEASVASATRAAQLPPIGVVTVDSTGATCLTIDAANLRPGLEVVLLDAPDTVPVRAARVVGRRSDCGQADTAYKAYELAMTRGAIDLGRIYVAVATSPDRFRPTDRGLEADLDGDGRPERVRICTSAEGLHLAVWSGAPPLAERRWHYYHYLGYDVEPTCQEADFPASPRRP